MLDLLDGSQLDFAMLPVIGNFFYPSELHHRSLWTASTPVWWLPADGTDPGAAWNEPSAECKCLSGRGSASEFSVQDSR